MKRNPDGTWDLSGLDPFVEQELRGGVQRAARRAMPEGKRKKAARDAARNRRMIDLPVELEQTLEEIAADLSVPVSQLIVALINRGMYSMQIEELQDLRQPSRSMRYEYTLPADAGKTRR